MSNTTKSTIKDYITILILQNVLINKPTLKDDSYFVIENNSLNSDSLPDDENVGNFDQTLMYIDHNVLLEKFTKPISTKTSHVNFYKVLDSMKAELMVLKPFAMDDLYATN